jgi:hypothetical protein
MDDSSNLQLSDGTTPAQSGSPATSHSEVTPQEMATLDLTYIIKGYDVPLSLYSPCHNADVTQIKSPSEVVAILREFFDAKKHLDQMKIRGRYSSFECRITCREIRIYQTYYNASIGSLPSTLDTCQLSTSQIDKLGSAMEYDKKAGEATWVLFEKQKQMHNYLTALEKLVTITAEHLVMNEQEESDVQAIRVWIAEARCHLRDLATQVVNARAMSMSR